MKQILVIDDDIHIGNLLEEILTKEGYGVSRAYSGTEALLVLSVRRPDLVLLDLMLPGLCGEEVLQSPLTGRSCWPVLRCRCAVRPPGTEQMFWSMRRFLWIRDSGR